mmetsp:Transcript_11868/g.28794  ORF Transcript_11868/g.28794 Transcript_11868/m.28794 type:complete len:216 (+) Transcript_11868:113-760(+)
MPEHRRSLRIEASCPLLPIFLIVVVVVLLPGLVVLLVLRLLFPVLARQLTPRCRLVYRRGGCPGRDLRVFPIGHDGVHIPHLAQTSIRDASRPPDLPADPGRVDKLWALLQEALFLGEFFFSFRYLSRALHLGLGMLVVGEAICRVAPRAPSNLVCYHRSVCFGDAAEDLLAHQLPGCCEGRAVPDVLLSDRAHCCRSLVILELLEGLGVAGGGD